MTTVTLPKLSQSGVNEWADVQDNDVAIRDVVNGQLDNGNIAAAAGIVDTKLASPNNAVYRSLLEAAAPTAGVAAGTYFINPAGVFGTGTGVSTGVPAFRQLVAADFAVASLTTRVRVRAQVVHGATAPTAATFTFGLYPLTITAGNWTLGAAISTVASSGLAVNQIASFASADTAFPADGPFCLGVVIAGAAAAAATAVSAQLQIRST